MLTALELENFKAFGSRTRIEFAPITLIFGENSAGKSSILQALNLLKQTRESRETGALLLPRSESGLVDLGSFQELIFDHDLNRSLSLRVDAAPQRYRSFPQRYRRQPGTTALANIGYELSVSRLPEDHEIRLRHLMLYLGNRDKPVLKFEPRVLDAEARRNLRQFPGFWRGNQPIRTSEIKGAVCVEVTDDQELWAELFHACKENADEIVKCVRQLEHEVVGKKGSVQPSLFEDENSLRDSIKGAIEFYSSDFTLGDFVQRITRAQLGTVVGLAGFVSLPGTASRSLGFPEVTATRQFSGVLRHRELFSFDAAALLFEGGRIVDDALESLFPMGPFRRPPERWYIFTGTSPQDVGYRGDLLPDLLFRRPELLNQTNTWLDRLRMGYHLTIGAVGTRSNDLFELRLIDQRRKPAVDVALSDVGFGISQLLPFVVQSLASEAQIITIEQPEVHIHPRLQADVGDLLAEAILPPRNHRFIIETHSEHLILRLLRRIRQTTEGTLPEGHPGLKPDQLSVIYVERESHGAKVHRLRVDNTGEFIDRWPKGFFEERAEELF